MTRVTKGMGASRAAAVAAAAVVAFSAALAIPALRGVERPEPTRAGQPVAEGAERIAGWFVATDVTLLPNLGYRLDIRLTRTVGAPLPDRVRPRVIVEMDGMERIEPPLALTGSGGYRAEGVLPMPGRWRFRTGFEEELLDLIVDVPAG